VKKRHDEEAWGNAKKVCRLNARQVEMARALGMNPKKLPGLRPSPQQRWKIPVGEFIEECYRKRFGGNGSGNQTHEPRPSARQHSAPGEDAQPSEAERNRMCQAENLICYLTNLAEDLQQWLAHGAVDLEVSQQIGAELREIADALDTGASIPQVPGIVLPPRETRAVSPGRDDHERSFDDDIPF
jgi:hypothetical protein